MYGIKDVFNLIVGMMLEGNGYSPDASINMIQFAICMWTANPFLG